jgi:ribosomal protein S25
LVKDKQKKNPDTRNSERVESVTHFLSNMFIQRIEKELRRFAFTTKPIQAELSGTRFSIGRKYEQKVQEFQ